MQRIYNLNPNLNAKFQRMRIKAQVDRKRQFLHSSWVVQLQELPEGKPPVGSGLAFRKFCHCQTY